MQLWINVTSNNVWQNLEDLLFGDDKKIGTWFNKNLPGEIYENLSSAYELQVLSMMQIKKLLGPGAFKNIKGFYFGTQHCEFLLPTLAETQQAIEYMKEFDKKYVSKETKRFVLMTPYFGNPNIRQRLIDNLEYLNSNAHTINPKTKQVEIIVNDFGTLNLLRQYPNLKPIVGNVLIKTLKNPIVDTFGLEKNLHIAGESMKNKSPQEITDLKKSVAENQRKGMTRSALNNEFFRKFLDKHDIARAGLDYLQDSHTLYDLDFDIDMYYPYALIFVGRLCDTSAISDIRRGYYPIDNVCPRTCWKYEVSMQDFETSGYKLIQKGNAGFKTQINLDLPANAVERYENRLIYTPIL